MHSQHRILGCPRATQVQFQQEGFLMIPNGTDRQPAGPKQLTTLRGTGDGGPHKMAYLAAGGQCASRQLAPGQGMRRRPLRRPPAWWRRTLPPRPPWYARNNAPRDTSKAPCRAARHRHPLHAHLW